MSNQVRLIDADALLERAKFWLYINIDDVKNAPTVDAAPVVRGQWQDINEGKTIRCTHCFSWVKADCIEGKDPAFSLPNYCPHCGAKMDGGSNNE